MLLSKQQQQQKNIAQPVVKCFAQGHNGDARFIVHFICHKL